MIGYVSRIVLGWRVAARTKLRSQSRKKYHLQTAASLRRCAEWCAAAVADGDIAARITVGIRLVTVGGSRR